MLLLVSGLQCSNELMTRYRHLPFMTIQICRRLLPIAVRRIVKITAIPTTLSTLPSKLSFVLCVILASLVGAE